jgi:serine/threonine-protein kinase
MTDFLSQLRRIVGAAYDIERELSGGGMSRVFVATERALGRRVVIKVLPPDLSAGVNMERFRREIQLAAQLHHPHIVPLLSTGEGDGILYYTMPFIEGESLRQAIERGGRFSVSDVVRVLHDVVDALAYAHGRGVIHRDIKPANILRLGAHSLVTDFGVAKALSAAMPISGLTTAGIAIGTPAYMAPEQLAGDPAADHRLDLYAVGLLAYELLIGSSPFSSSSPQATMAAQLTRVPEPLHELRPEIPRELSELIMRCLEKIPDDRPQTAIELQRQLDGVSTPRGAVMADDPLPELERRPSAARGALIGAAIVVALSAGAYTMVVNRSNARANAAAADSAAARAQAAETTATRTKAAPPRRSGTASQQVDTAALIAAAMSASSKSSTSAPPAAGSAGSTTPATSAPPPPPAAVVLSRADSLAIAQAVQAQLEAERLAAGERTRALTDSLRIAYERAFTDSIERVVAQIRASALAATEVAGAMGGGQRGRTQTYRTDIPSPLPPPRAGERRVAVVPFAQSQNSSRPGPSGVGDQIADSLRTLLAGRGTMMVVPESTTREIARVGRNVPTMIGTILDAPAVVTGSYSRRGGDSLLVRMQVTCLTCGGLGIREAVVPLSQPMDAVARLYEPLVRDLNRVRWTSVSGRAPARGVTPIPLPPGTRVIPMPPIPPNPPPD